MNDDIRMAAKRVGTAFNAAMHVLLRKLGEHGITVSSAVILVDTIEPGGVIQVAIPSAMAPQSLALALLSKAEDEPGLQVSAIVSGTDEEEAVCCDVEDETPSEEVN